MAVSGTDLFWGCPQMNFKANPPFNEMRQGFATFKKETRMAQYFPELFENLPDLVFKQPFYDPTSMTLVSAGVR